MNNLQTKEQGKVMEEKEKQTVDAYFDDKLEKATVTKIDGDYQLETSAGRFVRLSGEKSLEEAVAEHNELNKPLTERLDDMERERKELAKQPPQLTEEAQKRQAEEKKEE